MEYRKVNRNLAAKEYERANEAASEELRKEAIKEMTPEELRKIEVEKEMQRIRARMNQRLGKVDPEELKRQEEEQKAKIEALRQKLQRERQAQIIKEMAERNAVEHKATVKAAQMAARKEQEARESKRTSDFDLEEKRKKMMEAYYTQQDKVKQRKLMETEVDLEMAENDLEETLAAKSRMDKTEEIMQELREEQAKRIEKEKKEKTNAIQNIFKKLTSWPRRKIPTQEELNNDSLKAGTATVNIAETRETTMEEKEDKTVRTEESTLSMKGEEESTPISRKDNETLIDVQKRKLVENGIMTQEEINKMDYEKERQSFVEKAKRKIMGRVKNATQKYEYSSSIQSNVKGQTPLSRKDKKRTRNDMDELYGGFEIDHAKAHKAVNHSQESSNEKATFRAGWAR